MNITSPKQYRVADELTERMPLSIFLIFSHSCGHCQSYIPMWERLANLKKKKSNMFMMEANVFQQTPLAKKADEHGIQVNSVPTVLYVSPDGKIREASDIRNESAMTNIVLSGNPAELPPLSESLAEISKESGMNLDNASNASNVSLESEPEMANELIMPEESVMGPMIPTESVTETPETTDMPETTETTEMPEMLETTEMPEMPEMPDTTEMPETMITTDTIMPVASSTFRSVLPGVSIVPDMLHALPATTVSAKPETTIRQTGGSPWAAFLSSVAPAATLLGAYALLPKNPRASGLKRVSRRNKKMTRVSQA